MISASASADNLRALVARSQLVLVVTDVNSHNAVKIARRGARLRATGGRPFLLERERRLAGDADFRNLTAGAGEFAILIADPGAQGQGLGTRFARMLHAFALDVLRLERVYVAIIPENGASRRLFEKLGYRPDDSPVARRHADEPTDLTMSLELRPLAGAPVRIRRRTPVG